MLSSHTKPPSLTLRVLFLLVISNPTCVIAQERLPASGHLDAKPVVTDTTTAPTSYILGPDDQVTLFVADLDELSNKPMRIDRRGELNIPLAGRVHAAGLTADECESEIELRLKKQIKDPHVVLNVSEFRSQPVSVLGAVMQPGVHQLEGRKTLFEMLSLAGGLRPDCGNTVKISRNLKWGRIPLPEAKDDATGQFSVASISVKDIMNGANPAQNIIVKPEDTITVPKADLVYCVGSVHKPGGFPLGQDESLSALQVLSLAEGLDKTAAAEKAKILRSVPGSKTRTEIPLNLKKLMAGRGEDLRLQADDILFIPNSAARSALARSAEAAIQIATGVAIYGRY